MAQITPPPIRVQMLRSPETLTDGSEIEFNLWFGPLPVRWKARIESLSGSGFIDRQLSGPFTEWTHQHFYQSGADGKTEVKDQIKIKLRRHLFYGPLGLIFCLGLPILFAYRGWKTRRLLQAG